MTDGSKLVGVVTLKEQVETAFFLGIVWSLGRGGFPAALEPVALAVHFQDVDVVGEPVQQRPGEPLRAEDLGPLVEGKVGGGHLAPHGREPVRGRAADRSCVFSLDATHR